MNHYALAARIVEIVNAHVHGPDNTALVWKIEAELEKSAAVPASAATAGGPSYKAAQ